MLNEKNTSIEIINSLGQVVFTSQLNPSTPQPLNLSTFTPGIYFIKVNNHVQKFIKQ